MRSTQLSCYVCGGPIKKADHDHGEITFVDYGDPPGIVRAWHNRCATGYPPSVDPEGHTELVMEDLPSLPGRGPYDQR